MAIAKEKSFGKKVEVFRDSNKCWKDCENNYYDEGDLGFFEFKSSCEN
jgi:hypothetical protein